MTICSLFQFGNRIKLCIVECIKMSRDGRDKRVHTVQNFFCCNMYIITYESWSALVHTKHAQLDWIRKTPGGFFYITFYTFILFCEIWKYYSKCIKNLLKNESRWRVFWVHGHHSTKFTQKSSYRVSDIFSIDFPLRPRVSSSFLPCKSSEVSSQFFSSNDTCVTSEQCYISISIRQRLPTTVVKVVSMYLVAREVSVCFGESVGCTMS